MLWLILYINLVTYATGCPDIWLNIIPGVSVRVVLDQTTTWICRLNKADAGVGVLNTRKGGGSPLLCQLFKLEHPSSPAFGLGLALLSLLLADYRSQPLHGLSGLLVKTSAHRSMCVLACPYTRRARCHFTAGTHSEGCLLVWTSQNALAQSRIGWDSHCT
jgi:hypothetical protein